MEGVVSIKDSEGNKLAGLAILDCGFTGYENLQSAALTNVSVSLGDPMLRGFLERYNYTEIVWEIEKLMYLRRKTLKM
ncbi:hypothetical protein [Flavobacterium branchiicola]|uniref:Uncharacterized protein n=1 Tax=Flavobacterium branchiicola TaxID=1114875 RepID=A0ABV9PIC5_9FLAO|nr:hypothetical protein [Flavobacterium branchiicola]MBS7256142.1 hypothetical protein [Flavobacterium branchiicola]